MKKMNLLAEIRSDKGKGPARRIRASGRVPAVFYGKNSENIHFSVDDREFRKVLEKAVSIDPGNHKAVGQLKQLEDRIGSR